ncbi:MAG: DUF362 domain-containing protein [Myxococcota bacterium]
MGKRSNGNPSRRGRRGFLRDAGVAAGASVLGVGCAGDDDSSAPDGAIGTPDAMPEDAMPDDANVDAMRPDAEAVPPGMAAVALSGADIEAAVRSVIGAAGGLDAIRPGDTVFIKPNAVHPFVVGPGIVTSNPVLEAVIRAVRDYSPGRVIVGDRSARPFESAAALTQSGQQAAAMAAGADEIYAAPRPADDPDAWVMLQPEGYESTWGPVGGLLAMRKIVEANHFINVPVLKDHRGAVFSLSLKNLIGAVGDDTRDRMHYVSQMPEQLSQDIVILNKMFQPTLNILDARGALINGGPEGTDADAVRASPELVLASRDRVALDAVGVALLKLHISRTTIDSPDEAQSFLAGPIFELPQLRHGITEGLGVMSAEQILLRFDQVADSDAIEATLRA